MSGFPPETLRAQPNGTASRPGATACPRLGLIDDRASHAMFAVPQHRCYAAAQPIGIPVEHQQSFCLTTGHYACPVFQGAPPPWRQRSSLPVLRPGRGRFHPSRAWLRRWAVVGVAIVAGVIIVAGTLAFARSRQSGSQAAAVHPLNIQPSPAALVVSASPAATATPAPASATATPAPATPTPAPATPSPTPAPTRYTVQAGEGLSGLAERFGVTLAALASANNLTVTSPLELGQILIIPATRATPTPTPAGGR